MKTRAEQLPIEIWISIFHYFEIHDLFHAFADLNAYFESILASEHLSFYVHLEKCDQFYKQLAFFSPWSSSILNRMIYLKSSTKGRGKYLSQFLHWHGDQFLRLKSLTIEVHRQELWPNCIEFFKSHPIEYLSLACIPNEILLEGILSSPVLYQCRLYFWRTTSSFHSNLDLTSNIEILYIRLKDDCNPSLTNYLLSHMPKLKRLEMVGDHVQHYFNPDLCRTSSQLEKVKLLWLRRNMNLDYFERLLSQTPNMKSISIAIYCHRLNESFFENLIHHWWPSLDRIPLIKLRIKCHGLARTNLNNEHKIFDNYCREILGRINTRTDVCLDMKWIEENSQTHTIQMIIRKFWLNELFFSIAFDKWYRLIHLITREYFFLLSHRSKCVFVSFDSVIQSMSLLSNSINTDDRIFVNSSPFDHKHLSRKISMKTRSNDTIILRLNFSPWLLMNRCLSFHVNLVS